MHEGAAEPLALLGLIRLVHYLSEPAAFGRGPCDLVTDCGTGVTAIGAPPLSSLILSHLPPLLPCKLFDRFPALLFCLSYRVVLLAFVLPVC